MNGAKAEKKEREEAKLSGKWSFSGIEVQDPGLQRYISLKPTYITHSGGRHEHVQFKKSEINIVERLITHLMRPGRSGGKKARAIRTVKNAFEIISLKTGKNPIEVLVRALENAAPCEDTTRISYGGIIYHVAVDVSPQRRIDLALRFLTEGAKKATFGNPKTFDECLAEEIILAASRDSRSYAVSKRDEMERVALSSR